MKAKMSALFWREVFAIESIIIAIVIGIIANLFNRMNGDKKKKPAPKKFQTSPGPVAQLPEEKKAKKKKKQAKKQEKPIGRIASASTQVKEQTDRLPQRERRSSMRDNKVSLENKDRSLLDMEEEDILKGIIFSEVLAPPKARRKK